VVGSGIKGSMEATLSCTCSRVVMPESTHSTLGRLATQRMAQLARLFSGAA